MNPVLLGAIALGSVPTTQPSTAAHSLWTSLDRDFAALAQDAKAEKKGVEVGAYLKTSYRDSADIQVNGEDESGQKFNGARLEFKGKVGAFELVASIDGANGDVETKDFYARTKVCSGVNVKIGQYRSPFLFSGVAGDTKEIFYDRTTQGNLWSVREPGIGLDGVEGRLAWWLSLHNGGDAAGNDHLLIGKAAVALLGDVILPKQTGNYGVDAKPAITVGVGYADDGSAASANDPTRHATAVSAEVVAVMGRVFFLAEAVNYDEDFVKDIDNVTAGNQNSVGGGQAARASNADVADSTPFGATAGFMITGQDEVAVRWENLNDSGAAHEHSTQRYWLGYTRYFEGHPAKVQVNWIHEANQDANGSDDTVDEAVIGLVIQI
ncbi:MAG: hypothetical protein IT454_15055 [Planctomycetes bacterium]|nr:hypothetical protein [Planctomycetota bacterium]